MYKYYKVLLIQYILFHGIVWGIAGIRENFPDRPYLIPYDCINNGVVEGCALSLRHNAVFRIDEEHFVAHLLRYQFLQPFLIQLG